MRNRFMPWYGQHLRASASPEPDFVLHARPGHSGEPKRIKLPHGVLNTVRLLPPGPVCMPAAIVVRYVDCPQTKAFTRRSRAATNDLRATC